MNPFWYEYNACLINKIINNSKTRNYYDGNWFDKGIIFFTFVVTNSIYVANKARQKKAINLANKEICIYLKSILY